LCNKSLSWVGWEEKGLRSGLFSCGQLCSFGECVRGGPPALVSVPQVSKPRLWPRVAFYIWALGSSLLLQSSSPSVNVSLASVPGCQQAEGLKGKEHSWSSLFLNLGRY
jgi:hypothetical protein